ncbi:MAG TPA: DNA alkylation repair protein [Candidatus Paceibacterota bacterium]|nr:DNA alkylation repair protein [Candidatus Paceibacterota bacterium]
MDSRLPAQAGLRGDDKRMNTNIIFKAKDIKAALKSAADPTKAKILKRFFKTGKGDYGAGDKFLGIIVPEQRKIANKFSGISLVETEALLQSKYHEERLTALLILVAKFNRGNGQERKEVFDIYKKNTDYINNWDLVDLSAPNIIGEYLKEKDRLLLYKYARSKELWERRIAIVSTFAFIKEGDCKDALKISEMLLKDRHDLIHKAVGWMLREVGKRCGEKILEGFLEKHIKEMPRTMLRYSIERLSDDKKKFYLQK